MPPSSQSSSDKQPLRGARILVGRARHQASALSSGLRELGATVLEIPFIEIRRPSSYKPLDSALKDLGNYDWLILTSVNGVEALWKRLAMLRISNRQAQYLKIAAIGPATQKAIEEHGLKVHVVPPQYVAESVVQSLRKQVDGKRVLLARAKIARDVIPRELRKIGAQVDVVEAYQTVIPRASRIRLQAAFKAPQRRPTVITFTSSSSVRNFMELLKPLRAGKPRRGEAPLPQGIQFASIGPVTSATLREVGLPVTIEARRYTIPGLIAAIAAARRSKASRPRA
jgi:uroporphyrinogen-III synthase